MGFTRCSTCKTVFADNLLRCPNCGCPSSDTVASAADMTHCASCGAPITGSPTCEYCGTVIPKRIPANSSGSGNPAEFGKTIGTATAAFLGGLIGGLIDD